MILNVTDREGKTHAIEAEDGWRVMEVIRDAAARDPALGIKAECGGALSCATCHVYVDLRWLARLHPVSGEEKDMLDGAFDVRDNSRLSCQILMSRALDGLKVTLAPGSEP
jgi:2Fe-2S ferredoxin